MVEVENGDRAPEFTAPVADDDGIGSFTLSERCSESPVLLAFFPAAFTGTCTTEMGAFRDRIDEFRRAGVDVYGVSVDSPFALAEFRSKHDLPFGLVSDFEKSVIDEFGIRTDFADVGVYGLAKRAVLLVDTDRTVAYRWVSDDPGIEPDYDAVLQAASDV